MGSTTRLADSALLKAIERTTIKKSFDEELLSEFNCEDIDFPVASHLIESHRKIQENDFLSLGLISKQDKELIPTIGGVLLFGKNRFEFFPDSWIQVAVFEGFDKSKIIDTQNITTYLPQSIDETLNFVKRNLGVGLKIKTT